MLRGKEKRTSRSARDRLMTSSPRQIYARPVIEGPFSTNQTWMWRMYVLFLTSSRANAVHDESFSFSSPLHTIQASFMNGDGDFSVLFSITKNCEKLRQAEQ